jgi:hypothetical protein
MSDRIALWPIHERPDLVERLPPELRGVGARCYVMGHTRIIIANEPDTGGWHLSISCADREMYLPPINEYVNLHPFTFHLYEVAR